MKNFKKIKCLHPAVWKHRWLNAKNWLKLTMNYSTVFYFNERKANTTTKSLYKYFLLDKSALYVPLNVDVEFLRMKRSSFIPQFSLLKSWNNNWSSTIFLIPTYKYHKLRFCYIHYITLCVDNVYNLNESRL